MKKILYILLLLPIITHASNLTPTNPRLVQDTVDKIITTCDLKTLQNDSKNCFPQNVHGYSTSNIDLDKDRNSNIKIKYIFANTLNIREIGINTNELGKNVNFITESLEKERVQSEKSATTNIKKIIKNTKNIRIDYITFYRYKQPYQYDIEEIDIQQGIIKANEYQRLNEEIKKNTICKNNQCISTLFKITFSSDNNEINEKAEKYFVEKYFKNLKPLIATKEKLNLRMNISIIYSLNGKISDNNTDILFKKSKALNEILDHGEINYE